MDTAEGTTVVKTTITKKGKKKGKR